MLDKDDEMNLLQLATANVEDILIVQPEGPILLGGAETLFHNLTMSQKLTRNGMGIGGATRGEIRLVPVEIKVWFLIPRP